MGGYKNQFILTWGNRLHDFLSLNLVINLECEEVSGCSELELSDAVFLVLLDSDLFGTWEVLLLSSHNLDEFLKVLNFLGLYAYENLGNLPFYCSFNLYNKY